MPHERQGGARRDQALIRTGFKMILESEDDIEVVGEAGDGEQAISLTRSVRPDVVLMDVQMPRMDGLEATGVIARDRDPRGQSSS